jgi:hypothetical protein
MTFKDVSASPIAEVLTITAPVGVRSSNSAWGRRVHVLQRDLFSSGLSSVAGKTIASSQFRPDSGETSNPSPQLYRHDGTRPKAPHQLHCLAVVYFCWSCYLNERIPSSRLEDGDELCEPPVIRVTRRTITVGLDPFRMLRHEIAMQLFLQISIRSNLTPARPQLSQASLCRPCVHDRTLGFGARSDYSAFERFPGAPSVGLQALSFG